MTDGFKRQNQTIEKLEKEKEKMTQHIYLLQERIKIFYFEINQTQPLQAEDHPKETRSSPSQSKMNKKGVHSTKNVEEATVPTKGTSSPVQTVAGEDFSNSLIADTLPKIRVSYWFLEISLVSLFRWLARSRGGAARGGALGPASRASDWGRRRPRGRGRAVAPARDREEEPQAAYVPPQPVGPGPAQPPPAPAAAAAPDLHAPAPAAPAPVPVEPAPAPQGQPAAVAPEVQPPPVHVTVVSDLKDGEMPLREQKMLGVFQRLAPPIFSGAIREDAHEFQLTCQEQL
ncbi:CASP-like protein 4A1 [Solanum stenotomum]|uniref:CASP-like protein 4A1 n=1 Tax=Solanum stenotomum TaxID=172797 RepID=UPI0020D0E351|nr:CASP-like protein 4A1 [Solanum stenotomum]